MPFREEQSDEPCSRGNLSHVQGVIRNRNGLMELTGSTMQAILQQVAMTGNRAFVLASCEDKIP